MGLLDIFRRAHAAPLSLKMSGYKLQTRLIKAY
jgi:hypothetical protein